MGSSGHAGELAQHLGWLEPRQGCGGVGFGEFRMTGSGIINAFSNQCRPLTCDMARIVLRGGI